MDWIAEHWAIITTIAGIVVALLNAYGKQKYAKVVGDLVNSIEKANASDVKALAQSASVKSGTAPLLAKIVKALTEGD
jgi:hypothetical protein